MEYRWTVKCVYCISNATEPWKGYSDSANYVNIYFNFSMYFNNRFNTYFIISSNITSPRLTGARGGGRPDGADEGGARRPPLHGHLPAEPLL